MLRASSRRDESGGELGSNRHDPAAAPGPDLTSGGFVRALAQHAAPAERALIQKRLAPGDRTGGIRMRDLFDLAREWSAMPLAEVAVLLDGPSYEARMGAVSIMDLRAKDASSPPAERQAVFELYLDRHDRLTTWDMVDRAAPSVVGRHLMGGSAAVLHDLARAGEPLRRRTAITAPLWWVRHGEQSDLDEMFALAGALLADPDPVVRKPVGIALKHAGAKDPDAVLRFLDEHGDRVPAPVRWAALSKIGSDRPSPP